MNIFFLLLQEVWGDRIQSVRSEFVITLKNLQDIELNSSINICEAHRGKKKENKKTSKQASKQIRMCEKRGEKGERY